MYDNLPTTLSNLPIIFPILLAVNAKDFVTAYVISFVMVMSTVSHLVENHKHCMLGINGVSQQTSYLFNRLDVLGCFVVLARFAWLMWYFEFFPGWDEVFIVSASFAMNFISELDKYNPSLKWPHYIPLHSLWHLMASRNMYVFLHEFYGFD